jgi:prevent-host-death family protein
MRDQQPMTETMKVTEVKQQLHRLVNRVYRHETRVVIEKNGISVAGIVSAEDLRRLDRLDHERAERFKVLKEFGEAFKDVPAEELERETARAIAEVRAERRAEQAQVVGATA